MDITGLGPIFDLGGKIIDKIFPDPEQRDAAKLALLKQQQAGELDELKISMSAILAEANSKDPWTSRARPSFLYVVYLLLLWSIPMGFMFMYSPEASANFTAGFKAWMDAIPLAIIDLFKAVMLGYIGGRSIEKTASVVNNIIGKKKEK